ncbi:MAG: type II and III secretion system protein [Chlorobiaceae bacterium]|nr:type II and III secretion system protein [Chlorobiaceae bacterium]
MPTRTIQYKDIGIILKVKPQINDSGLITLQIAQEVSTYTTIKLYANEDQIILNKTEATTSLVVKNGQTIVIGGLIREDDSKAREGIPWLSKIPILGYLFGNTTKEKNRTELVILLTPYIVKDQQDVASVTNKYADKITDKYIGKELKQSIHEEKNEQKEKAEKK